MAPRHAQDPEFAARFRQEAQATARLRSPHVAQILDHGITTEGEPYIVMELLEGETLQRRLQRVRQLPLDQLVVIVGQTERAPGRAAARRGRLDGARSTPGDRRAVRIRANDLS